MTKLTTIKSCFLLVDDMENHKSISNNSNLKHSKYFQLLQTKCPTK